MLNLQVLGNKFQSRLLQIIDTRFVFMFVLPQLIKGFYVYYNAYHVSIPFFVFFSTANFQISSAAVVRAQMMEGVLDLIRDLGMILTFWKYGIIRIMYPTFVWNHI